MLLKRIAKAAITFWSALKSKFGCTYKEAPDEQVSAVPRYHFPLETADPHDREYANAWLTPRVLLDPENRAPELELIEQLEADGHDVTGAKIRILAMREAVSDIERARADMKRIRERLWPVLENISVCVIERGKNVLFREGAPDHNDPICRHVYRDQMTSGGAA